MISWRGALRCRGPIVYCQPLRASAFLSHALYARGAGRGTQREGVDAAAVPRFNLRDQMCGERVAPGRWEGWHGTVRVQSQAEASTYLLAPSHREPRRTPQRASMCTSDSGRIRASLHGAPKRTWELGEGFNGRSDGGYDVIRVVRRHERARSSVC